MGIVKQRVTLIFGKKRKIVFALLDTGAETSFIKYSLAKKLGLPKLRKTRAYIGGTILRPAYETIGSIIIDRIRHPIAMMILADKDLDERFVIGADFMQSGRIIVNPTTHKLSSVKPKWKYKGFRL